MNNQPDARPGHSASSPAETAQPVSRTCGLARVSFCLGLISSLLFGASPCLVPWLNLTWYFHWNEQDMHFALTFFGLVLATALGAKATGLLAGKRLKADPTLEGKGWARAGSIMGGVISLLALGLISAVLLALPSQKLYACINNLRQIDRAKESWALENKKTATDTPTWADLIGTDKYIKQQPSCPGAGTYTLNDMVHKPRCSIPGHTLP